jgi:hypothetical protein
MVSSLCSMTLKVEIKGLLDSVIQLGMIICFFFWFIYLSLHPFLAYNFQWPNLKKHNPLFSFIMGA